MKAEVTYDRDGWRDVKVPNEAGTEYSVIQFRRCPDWPAWRVEISDKLLRLAPQAIHAALGQALMAMQQYDGEGGEPVDGGDGGG